MGQRGPKAQPTALRVLRGNPGKRKLNDSEPKIRAPLSTEPPTDLVGEGLLVWKRLINELISTGVLTDADLETFADYCSVRTDIALYKERAKDAGPELAIAKGYQNALVKLRGQAKQLAAELGLTPSARSGVKATKPKTKLEAFLGGKTS